jgi:hypothetical protein
MGTAAGSGTGPWTFTWPLASVTTGTYSISVRANSGKDGAVRHINVPVKDNSIGPPTNLFGGTNQLWSNVVELSWTPVAASVLGYEVQRFVGGVWSTVTCYDVKGTTAATPRPTGSYCLDKAASGASQYRVFTVFSVGGTPTMSHTSVNLTIGTNLRPCPPTGLAVNSQTDTISWVRPATTTATCDGSRIRFYRVYRELTTTGSGLPAGYVLTTAQRVFQTSGPGVTSWLDAKQPNKKSHYWVTSVDNLNAESTLVGPVN